MSRRTERVGSLIRSLLAEAIQNRLSDPRIPLITSITRVQVSEDLTVARVFVSVMGSPSETRLCLAALAGAARRLRRWLAPQLRMRKIPLLQFRLDDSVRRSLETVTAIDQAMRELGQPPEWERQDADGGQPTDDDRRPAVQADEQAAPQAAQAAETPRPAPGAGSAPPRQEDA